MIQKKENTIMYDIYLIFQRQIFDQSLINCMQNINLTLNNKFIGAAMKNSKTQKKSLQPHINLPPIHKQSLISEELSFEQSIDSVNSFSKRNPQKVSIHLAKMYTKNRNKSDSIAKENEKFKIKSKFGSLVDSQQTSNRKAKKSKNQHLRQQTQLLLGKKNPESSVFQQSFQHFEQKYRKLQTQANINDEYQNGCGNGIPDTTLMEFKRKIAQNKAYIKEQIVKRSKEKQLSTNPSHKKLVKPNKQTKNQIISKPGKSREVKNNQHPTQCTTPKGGINQNLFSHLQQILLNKVQIDKKRKDTKTIDTSQPQLFVRDQHQNRVQKLVTKIRKLSPEQSRQNIKEQAKQYISAVPSKFKDINNYSQWRKIDLSKAEPIKYTETSFEIQQSRLSQIIERNDSSIANYLESKRQLLRLGMRVYTEQER